MVVSGFGASRERERRRRRIIALCGWLSGGGLRRRVFMKTSGITATLPAQDLGRAQAFYSEKVGLDGKEGVDGSSPSEGFEVSPA
jgi:hypothetical protein